MSPAVLYISHTGVRQEKLYLGITEGTTRGVQIPEELEGFVWQRSSPILEHMYLPDSRERLREAECTLPKAAGHCVQDFAFHNLIIIRAAGHPDFLAWS